EDVHEEPELRRIGPCRDDCREQTHAPGFQTITTSRAVNQTIRIQCAKAVRRSIATAESSPTGCTPRLARAPDPVASTQRMSAAMIQPSQISYSGRLRASQIPKTSVPSPPTPQRISATRRVGRLTGEPRTKAL